MFERLKCLFEKVVKPAYRDSLMTADCWRFKCI